ncbi:hypothetical protein [Owenweeksia hongkongensis]|uniref:hypothetical protein n=1 Tax=Owenweeksia hongkongensis TaxID=253245 RepID=UPI003A8E915D
MITLKQLLLGTLFLVGNVFVMAQEPVATEIISDKVKGTFHQFVEEKDGSVYAIMVKGKNYFLRKFDSETLEIQDEWEVGKFKHEGQKTEFKTAVVSKEGFYLIYEAYNPVRRKIYFVEKFVSRSGEARPNREVASVDNITENYKVKFLVSEDKSRFSIVTPPGKNVAPKAFVFDDQLNLQWEQSYGNPFKDGNFTITQTELSNDGDVLVVGYRDDGRFKEYEIKTSTKYGVLRIDKEKNMMVYDLSHLNKTFHGLSVKPDLTEGFVLTGFYADDEDGYPYGLYYSQLSKNTFKPTIERLQSGKSANSNDLDQSFDILHAAMGGRMKEGFASFRCKDFTKFENGNIAVVAERDYVNSLPGAYRNRFVGEIVVFSFNPKGQLLWVKSIPKKQTDNNMGTVSYVFHMENNEVFLLYNDDVRNAQSINEGMGNQYSNFGRKFGLIGAKIDADGNMTLESIQNPDGKYFYVKTASAYSSASQGLFAVRVKYAVDGVRLSRFKF